MGKGTIKFSWFYFLSIPMISDIFSSFLWTLSVVHFQTIGNGRGWLSFFILLSVNSIDFWHFFSIIFINFFFLFSYSWTKLKLPDFPRYFNEITSLRIASWPSYHKTCIVLKVFIWVGHFHSKTSWLGQVKYESHWTLELWFWGRSYTPSQHSCKIVLAESIFN